MTLFAVPELAAHLVIAYSKGRPGVATFSQPTQGQVGRTVKVFAERGPAIQIIFA